jgi:hypothetical protein
LSTIIIASGAAPSSSRKRASPLSSKGHVGGEHVPEIEPPCADCVTRREATQGKDLWCARHSEHHIRPHRYTYVSNGIYSAETTAYEATPEHGA